MLREVTDLMRVSSNLLNTLNASWMLFQKSMWYIIIKLTEHCTLSFSLEKSIWPRMHNSLQVNQEEKKRGTRQRGETPFCPNHSRQEYSKVDPIGIPSSHNFPTQVSMLFTGVFHSYRSKYLCWTFISCRFSEFRKDIYTENVSKSWVWIFVWFLFY